MKNNIFKYFLPPLIAVLLIWISTIAFDLLSAASDFKVALGICILIILFAFVFRYIVSIFK